MAVLNKPAAGRPWFQRLTIVGAAIFAAVQAAEASGQVPPGTASASAELVKVLGGFLATVGVYRHIAA